MLHSDDGVARRFDNDVDIYIKELVRVGHDGRGAVPEGGSDVRRDLVLGPTHKLECPFGALDVDVGDSDDMDSRDVVCLSQVHGAVAAGSDESDSDRTAILLAVAKKLVEVHGDLSDWRSASRRALHRRGGATSSSQTGILGPEWNRFHFCTSR
ncbi:hypothetical protein D9M72_494520 [compost metagenome]